MTDDNPPDVEPGEARTIARFLRQGATKPYTDTRLIAMMNTAAQMLESLSARVTQAETTVAEVRRLAVQDIRCPCCSGYVEIVKAIDFAPGTGNEASE